jgi:Leucine-rich repeat (LRR) protein
MLRSLPIGGMNLTSLPESLGDLTQITHFYIWGNSLMKVPAWLFKLTTLQFLNMNSIGISELPEEIGALKT